METQTPEKKKIHQGRNMKRWRQVMGVTQIDIADFLEINQQAVSRIEDKEVIDDETLEKIAKIMKMPVDTLKNIEPEEQFRAINNTLTNNEIESNVGGNGKQEINNTYYYCTFHPLDKVTELYERLLEVERKNK